MTSSLEARLAWQITVAGLPQPAVEFVFHPPRRWRFDFAWADKMLAVEINGAIYAGGRHSRGDGLEKDYEKLNQAAIDGWCVLQFSGNQITNGCALEIIELALKRNVV